LSAPAALHSFALQACTKEEDEAAKQMWGQHVEHDEGNNAKVGVEEEKP